MVALSLRAVALSQAIDRHAGGEIGGDDVIGAVLFDHRRHGQHWVVAQPRPVLGGGSRFGSVISFVLELRSNTSEQGRDVDARRHQAGRASQKRQIGHIAGNALAYARILNFQGQHPAVVGFCAMHLADRCRRNRAITESTKASAPVAAVLALKHLNQLGGRHLMGLIAKTTEQIGNMRWQQTFAVHRQQLADLHHCPPHRRETLGEPTRVGRMKQQRRQFGTLTVCQAIKPVRCSADGHLAQGTAEVP